MKSPVEIFVQQYKAAAAEGAVVELKLRLLADKVPELQILAHDVKLEGVETLVIQHFADALTDQDKDMLTHCRKLRNKMLHVDFRAVRQRLAQGDVTPGRGDVKSVDIRGLSAKEMIEKIGAVKQGAAGSFEFVADSPTGPGMVFGWLLELGVAGDFILAARVFARGAAIVDRLSLI